MLRPVRPVARGRAPGALIAACGAVLPLGGAGTTLVAAPGTTRLLPRPPGRRAARFVTTGRLRAVRTVAARRPGPITERAFGATGLGTGGPAFPPPAAARLTRAPAGTPLATLPRLVRPAPRVAVGSVATGRAFAGAREAARRRARPTVALGRTGPAGRTAIAPLTPRGAGLFLSAAGAVVVPVGPTAKALAGPLVLTSPAAGTPRATARPAAPGPTRPLTCRPAPAGSRAAGPTAARSGRAGPRLPLTGVAASRGVPPAGRAARAASWRSHGLVVPHRSAAHAGVRREAGRVGRSRTRRERGPEHVAPTPVRRMVVRRRPTLPPRPRGSTIGAGRLSFRVRNGTGRFPLAVAAVTL